MTRRSSRYVTGRGLFLHNDRRQVKLLGSEPDVNVFEEHAAGDATNAIGGFDEIVTGLTAVFPTEGIGEDEGLGELTRTHEKASAIKIPIASYMHDFHRFGS